MAGWPARMVRQVVIVPALTFVLGAAPVLANGWEHWGIPLEVLLETLDGDDPGYRLMAARSLGIRGERKAVPRLLEILRDTDERPWVRIEVLQALGLIGDTRAVPGLLDVLRGDVREELRGGAAVALSRLATPSTLESLIEAFEGERSLIVRADIVAALGSFGQPRAVSTLARLVGGNANASLKRKAIWALGRTGSRAATSPLLLVLAAARSEAERTAIVEALANIADPAARPALERLFDEVETPSLKARITVALGAIQDGSAVPKLIELLTSDLAAVRFFAVGALAAAGDPSAAEPLRRLYRRTLGAARLPSAKLDHTRIAAYLADQSLRIAVIRALTRLAPKDSLKELLDAAAPRSHARDSAIGLRLNEGSHELRRAAIVGLGYSRDAAATRFLVESGVLNDRDFRLRATALRALGVLRDPASASAIIPLLDDDSAEARWAAAKVLGRLGSTAAIAGLGARLGDRHPEVRRQAALSLGYLGARQSCPDLIRLARDDPEQPVRDAARATKAHLCRAP